jgi:hypothetical protein
LFALRAYWLFGKGITFRKRREAYTVSVTSLVIELVRFFSDDCDKPSIMGSSHAISQVNKVLRDLDTDGYGDAQVVRDFEGELAESPT